jgi:hypothetical protein
MNDSPQKDFWAALTHQVLYSDRPFSLCHHDWIQLMGEFLSRDALEDWLIDQGECTDSLACPQAIHCLKCGFLEIEQQGDLFYAKCPEDKRPPFPLTREDVALKEYNILRLHQELAKLIPGLFMCNKQITPLSWLIGILHRETDREDRNVFVSYLNPMQILPVIPTFCMICEKKPFILFSPFKQDIPTQDLAVCRGMEAHILSLQEHFSIAREDGKPELHMIPKPVTVFQDSSHSKGKPQKVFVPSGCVWADIRITFQDRFTINCWIKGHNYTRTYHDFGMVDSRSGQPDSLWYLLWMFSEAEGQLTINWNSKRSASCSHQRKYRLDLALRQYFGIDSPAISYSYDKTAYVCAFIIRPDSYSTVFHRKQRT